MPRLTSGHLQQAWSAAGLKRKKYSSSKSSSNQTYLTQGREEMWVKALQQEHLSQEVEDDSMKQIPDNIDFSMEPAAGTDETDRQSVGMAEQLMANSCQQKAKAAEVTSHSESSSSRPLSPLKPAIPAKPSLAALAVRRLSHPNQQTSNNENTSLPVDVLPTEEQPPFTIPVDLETPSLLKSMPPSSLEALSDR